MLHNALMVDTAVIGRLRFRYPWRPYQARVLDAIQSHLSDDKLHIVAAPGSGKTILGLETFRRLGAPALILAPTITIRNQWLERLELFLPDGESCADFTTTDISKPAVLTCATYQSLHAKFRESDERDEDEFEAAANVPDEQTLSQLFARFRAAGVRTVILDEAHHLRREWWRALDRLIHQLGDVTIVSLTATPPYDVIGREWERYETLSGPIDEEISVPELVKSGTLAPHQDYVYAVRPDEDAQHAARTYDAAVDSYVKRLSRDETLTAAVQSHPWIIAPEEHADEILESPELAVSMLVVLRAIDAPLPDALLGLFSTDAESLPASSRRWWQVLIRSFLFDDHWPKSPTLDTHREEMKRQLRADGLLHARELRIEASKPVGDSLAQSPAKIDACVQIHAIERKLRGDRLRQVVLTDYIRDNSPPSGLDAKLGAWPIFAALLEAATQDETGRFALLTGRLALIHRSHLAELRAALGDSANSLQARSFDRLADFAELTMIGGASLVPCMTTLLATGVIDTLVGTRSLLGEGWDAPVINSLVLASHVGSYVTTNQMRGRAIRKDPADPDKAASIWHLIANDHESSAGQSDAFAFSTRANAFVGLHATNSTIESGVVRLELPEPWSKTFVEDVNTEMRRRVERIDSLADRWTEAIAQGMAARILPAVRSAPHVLTRRKALVANSIGRLFAAATATALGPMQQWLNWWITNRPAYQTAARTLAVAATIALVISLPGLYRAIRSLIRFYPVEGAVRQIAIALRAALSESGHLTTPIEQTQIDCTVRGQGDVSVTMSGATFYESSLFADCMREVLAPIDNPRYLIVRTGRRIFGAKTDYHAVPSILGERKTLARSFFNAWKAHVGPANLIYTRNATGRRALLQARVKAYSSLKSIEPRRVDQWC